jgi:hypothetical protein
MRLRCYFHNLSANKWQFGWLTDVIPADVPDAIDKAVVVDDAGIFMAPGNPVGRVEVFMIGTDPQSALLLKKGGPKKRRDFISGTGYSLRPRRSALGMSGNKPTNITLTPKPTVASKLLGTGNFYTGSDGEMYLECLDNGRWYLCIEESVLEKETYFINGNKVWK